MYSQHGDGERRGLVRQKRSAHEPKAIRMGRHLQRSSDPIVKRKTEKKVKEFYHNAKVVKKGERAKRRYERETAEAYGSDSFYDRYFGGGDLQDHEQAAVDDFNDATNVDAVDYFSKQEKRKHLIHKRTKQQVEDMALAEKLEGLVGPLRGQSNRAKQRQDDRGRPEHVAEKEDGIAQRDRSKSRKPAAAAFADDGPSSRGKKRSRAQRGTFDADVQIYENSKAEKIKHMESIERKKKTNKRKRRDRARKNRSMQNSMAARIRYVSSQVEKMVEEDSKTN